ncbi:MAG: amidohydrolase family protein [candidate division KSB1 bacterium]|nr:amidohydrolase family protein [candidate division KSB1 bacterium]MDZ7302226.1 amidohydrolase family protein [candidate division KSB1 bacterium]MDZ7311332.1 amidohydrolase family protein [candidate division KSB1 bacterium]
MIEFNLAFAKSSFQKTPSRSVDLTSIWWLGVFLLSCWCAALGYAQTSPTEGLRDNTPKVHAFINARIVVAPGQIIEKGTVVIRDGIIEAVGATAVPPADARLWDLAGLTIYPGLIETCSNIGLPKEERRAGSIEQTGQPQRSEPARGSSHWNKLVHPENHAAEMFVPNKEDARKMRELGFTVALTAPAKGVFRGTSALVTLGEDSPNKCVIKARVAQHFAFETAGGFDDPTYPNSLLGAIALIRQTILDARWYGQAQAAYRKNPAQPKPEEDEALAALFAAATGAEPLVFEAADELNFLRAVNIAREFNLKLWVRGSGHEYRRLDLIRAANVPVILPLNFPEAPKVETPEEALEVELAELQHWNAAPENPKLLQDAGIVFTLTTATLKNVSEFPSRLRTAISRGLAKEAALAALTITPAKLLGMENQLGTIAPGKLANLVVTDGDLFAEKTRILETWVAGVRYENKQRPAVDLRGKWEMTVDSGAGRTETLALDIKGEPQNWSGEIIRGSKKAKLTKLTLEDGKFALLFTGDSLGYSGIIRLSGLMEKESAMGTGVLGDGTIFKWTTKRIASFVPEEKTGKKVEAPALTWKPVFPAGGYGRSAPPVQPKNLLVRGATIWTCGPQGTLENADLLISAGKIINVGKNLSAPANAVIIEATGKHLTPGLIDAHSHSAAASINESAQAVTAEVRIGDVIDCDDITIYRQLAGGTTVAHSMHGSANPIGGQNQTFKWRWGGSPEELRFVETPPTIKFALGENVKQSNWGDRFTTRYPQTRMGVEQLIRDRFKAALDYKKAWAEYEGKIKALPAASREAIIPPRRDLELEALVEILDGKRFIHCHSYVQSEISMLSRIARDFGFKIGAFQHVLEGYKVADEIAKYSGGGSCFSDWWAYKFEVYDAIPYNGALMHRAGVVVSFNSDSDELARRLNWEAAKAVKYGNLTEEEALKFVTLNPAKQLRVDKYVGSLEPGKDADFVIWSGHPLSTLTICEQTWIEGRKYFDRAEDLKMREEVNREREMLIQKVLVSKRDAQQETGGMKRPASGHSLDMPSFSEQRRQGECERP